jgi:hypothetical protein
MYPKPGAGARENLGLVGAIAGRLPKSIEKMKI